MQNHEGRSHAGPPPAAVPRPRWERPIAPRPGPQPAPEMNPPGDMLLDPPEALHAAELFGLLPQAARRDLVAGNVQVTL